MRHHKESVSRRGSSINPEEIWLIKPNGDTLQQLFLKLKALLKGTTAACRRLLTGVALGSCMM